MVDEGYHTLRVGVNGMPLLAVHTGIARYLKGLYEHMGDRRDVEVGYVLPGHMTSDRPVGAKQGGKLDSLLSLAPGLVYPLRVAHWLLYERYLGRLARKGQMDIIHESFYTPSKYRSSVPQVFTLHDLSLLKFPETHSRDRQLFFNRFFPSRLSEADHIIVPSEYVKRELSELAMIPDSSVSVIHEGVDDRFKPTAPETVDRVLKEQELPSEYLLFVGTLEPRKNLSVVLEALGQCAAEIPLVIVGWGGWGDARFQKNLSGLGLRERVFFPGYLSDDQLMALYSGATAFLYPSLYEGFGLPILEAMACGCPVLCSDVASIPEVAGEAALLLPPSDPEAWRHAIDSVCGDAAMRERLKLAGLERAEAFSWQNAADRTLELFMSLV